MNLTPEFYEAFASRARPGASQIVRPAVSHSEAERLSQFLAGKSVAELMPAEIRQLVEGNLWMLTPDAFRYFLPDFMRASLESYASVGNFVSELVGALTEPCQQDVLDSLDRASRIQHQLGLPPGVSEMLRKQQLEWIGSGVPQAVFRERFDGLTPAEGAAVLGFLGALRQNHGSDFPFRELETAVKRYWRRFQAT
jgi:hypothetical protein